MRTTYRGETIEVSFDLARCIHVGTCLLGLPAVFDLRRRPWIAPDAADPDTVAEVVRRCPSGALQYRRLDGGPDEAHGGTTVTPMRDGPLRVVGEVRIVTEDGEDEVLPRSTLCRCGQSASKPFCDNSHLRVGFRAPGEPFRVHLSPLRPATRAPIRRTEDPRQEP
jgi:uncharacterized Fe-S cluster protein YjdI/CDGSH-type Zn-finger protein